MEEKKITSPIDNQEMISPTFDSPSPDVAPPDSAPQNSASPGVHEEIRSTSLDSEEKRLSLAQRLAEAFREGVASARPDYDNPPDVRILPSPGKKRQQSADAGILNRVSQEGRSAAAIVGDAAASAADAISQLVRKAPAITVKYAEAFREGAASVKPQEGGAQRRELPSLTKKNWLPSAGGTILDRVFKAGGAAAETVRGAIVALKPGEVRGAGHKKCLSKKKIDDLYIEIGREAVTSWGNGLVETEKLSALLDELRKNEEEIQNKQQQSAEAAATRKAETARKDQAVKETTVTPINDTEDITFAVDVPVGGPDGQVFHLGDPQQQERPEGVDVAVAETPASAAPESEAPVSPPDPEYTVGAEVAPPPASPPVPEDAVEAEAVLQEEEIGSASDQAPAKEPAVHKEKPKKSGPAKGRQGGIAPSGRSQGRR
jgi:hypothetical protein